MSYLLDKLYYMNKNGDFDNDNEFERAKEKGDIIREGYYWINKITGEKFDDRGNIYPETRCYD